MRPIDQLLTALSKAPDSQIDKIITERLASLVDKPFDEIERGLKKCLDDSAYGALASDFAMMAMDQAWKIALKEIGKEPYYGPEDTTASS